MLEREARALKDWSVTLGIMDTIIWTMGQHYMILHVGVI